MTEPTIPSWSSMKKHYAETGYLPITKFTPPSSETGYEDSDINNAIESDAWNKVETAINNQVGYHDTPYHNTSLEEFLDDLAADKDNAELAQAINKYLQMKTRAAQVAEGDVTRHSDADDAGIPDDIYESPPEGVDDDYIDKEAFVDPSASVGPKNPPNEGAWRKKAIDSMPPDFRPNL